MLGITRGVNRRERYHFESFPKTEILEVPTPIQILHVD